MCPVERLMEKYVCSQQEEILCPSFWWVQKTVTYCSAGSIEYTWLLYGKDFQVIELQAVNSKQILGFICVRPKDHFFCRKSNQIHFSIDKIVLIVWPKIPQMPLKISAQSVCQSPKVWDFWKKLSLGVCSPWQKVLIITLSYVPVL